jgi:hypothetical protein
VPRQPEDLSGIFLGAAGNPRIPEPCDTEFWDVIAGYFPIQNDKKPFRPTQPIDAGRSRKEQEWGTYEQIPQNDTNMQRSYAIIYSRKISRGLS